MFLWRKSAEPHWVDAHEDRLQTRASGQLVIIRRPGHDRLELEIVCRSQSDLSALLKEFGGSIEALPRDWLERLAHRNSKPIKIGKRLMIVRFINELRRCGVSCPERSLHRRARSNALGKAHPAPRDLKAALLLIPAAAAFGTGEHATTAMSLRFLEQLTRRWKRGWSLVDLGTGSGILALAAKCVGACRVAGIDNDPAAISIAKRNARLNQIRGARFQLADVRTCRSAQEADVITANLYSDLLLEILPKLCGSKWLIVSGILRSQQDEVACALQQNHFEIISMKHRGKWTAFLAKRISPLRRRDLDLANFCGDHRPPLQ